MVVALTEAPGAAALVEVQVAQEVVPLVEAPTVATLADLLGASPETVADRQEEERLVVEKLVGAAAEGVYSEGCE